LWSINALSVELGLDRRTLAKRLDGLVPAQDHPKTYRLRDVLDYLRQYQDDLPDLDPSKMDAVIETVITSLATCLEEQLPKTLRATGSKDNEHIARQTEGVMLAFSFMAFSFAIGVGVQDEGALANIAHLGKLSTLPST
jgi:hypothetical protein